MMCLLLENRERWEALGADVSLAQGIVEEALRMEAPVQGLFRVAKVDVELGGVQVPAGAQLQMLYAAGSRDPREFENSEEFDMHRKNAVHHLAFGGGAHFCLGAALARLEGKILLEILTSRVPSLRLDLGEQAHRVPHFFLRGFEHLWAEWGTES